MRLLGILVFSLAATGATLAGSGLVVAPHVDPPGTPPSHDHVLAAYRFPIFLMTLSQRLQGVPKLTFITPLAMSLATLVMALLVFAWPRIPSPARRPVGYIAAPAIARALWSTPLFLGPPR